VSRRPCIDGQLFRSLDQHFACSLVQTEHRPHRQLQIRPSEEPVEQPKSRITQTEHASGRTANQLERKADGDLTKIHPCRCLGLGDAAQEHTVEELLMST